MKKILIIIAIFFIALLIFKALSKEKVTISPANKVQEKKQDRIWQIKSVDTMKYSRDLSLEKLNDLSFDQIIEQQVRAISQTGANYIAIATPYDDKFKSFLKRWVKSARDHKLKIWYRGNFSAWQGWFGEPKNLTQQKHLELTRNFIKNNPDLFQNGDIFSACPECENGGPGDPRSQTSLEGYRKFIIDERNAALNEFANINKKVMVADSMNYDVAKLVMDPDTARALGQIVVIDHYVKTSQKLEEDIEDLAKSADSKIMLGEFGVPIPDIHGNLTDKEQADWVEQTLSKISKNNDVIGLNYWVGFGGSTAVFNDNGDPKPAAIILKKYFTLPSLN